MDERSFYLSDYADEMMPCEPTLEAWAEWLANGGDKEEGGWAINVPADGTLLECTAIRWLDDIIATRQAGGEWTLSREPPPDAFLAVRFGPGMGWSPDNIVYGETDDPLREWLHENDCACDDEEYVAVGMHEGPFMLQFRTDPPRLDTPQ